MKRFHSKHKISLVAFSLLVGMMFVLPVLADEEGQSTDPNLVRGYISSVGRDYVQIESTRYTLSSNTKYTDEEGGVLTRGRRQMRNDMKVDLRLKGGIVVQVTIYGLLMR